ncbi:hypothetical protein ABKW28_10125 [Nocardioides sp. 31GB23]|uniref:hypothetical protein n=1 Tax=Nocardioides sp. 31GB23 TaxID=3156065 RepID=UPI0032AE9FBD
MTDTGTRADPIHSNWARIRDREKLSGGNTEDRIKEMEAIFVDLLGRGLTNVHKPRFGPALEWTQVVDSNYGQGGICTRADRKGFLSSESIRFYRRGVPPLSG